MSHFEYALKHKTWGVQERYSPSVINQITSIQKEDLVAFVGPGRNFPGRIELKHWCMRNFKGFFELLRLYRVTHGYYFDKTKIWPVKGKWKDELFPHRFNFDPEPVLSLRNIRINKLSLQTKTELHGMVFGNFITPSPSNLVDIIYHSERVPKGAKMERSVAGFNEKSVVTDGTIDAFVINR